MAGRRQPLSPLPSCIMNNNMINIGELEMIKANMLQKTKRHGSVMVLALCAVVILSVMGGALLSLGMNSRIFATRAASQVAARCAADAGLAKAVFEMNKKLSVTPWDGSTLPSATADVLPGTGATFSYSVTTDDAAAASTSSTGSYVIESVGQFGEASRKVTGTLRLKSPFEGAISTRGNLELKAGTLVDGYDSRDPSATDVTAPIHTTSTLAGSIILNAGVVVDGTVVVGPDGDVDTVIKDLGATTGARYACPYECEFPPVTAPQLDAKPKIIVKGAPPRTLGPGDSGKYPEIVLKGDVQPGILEVSGGDVVLHVTGKIDLGEGCEIIVNSGASLTLYVDGNIVSGNNSGFNNKNSPRDFKLFGTGAGQTFDIKAKSDIFGAVYAPNADIVMKASGNIYGSVVSQSFALKSGGNFYYDVALAETDEAQEAVRFIVTRWQEE